MNTFMRFFFEFVSIFIDGIISECKLQDIETLTPQQVAGMRLKWVKEAMLVILLKK